MGPILRSLTRIWTASKKVAQSIKAKLSSHPVNQWHQLSRLSQQNLEWQETATFLQSIIDNVPNMIFVKEAKDLKFIMFNQAGERLLGVSRQDLMGKSDRDFFPPEQAEFFIAKDREVLDHKKMLDIPEEPIDTPHGRRLLRTKKIALADREGRPTHLIGIAEDITDWKAGQQLIEEQRQALIHASKFSALGEMAGGIAHEINNPLAVISMIASQIATLVSRPTVDSERLTLLAQRLNATVDRIARIVRGLRDFSHDGGSDPFVPVAVSDIVESTLSFCREKFKNEGIEIRTDKLRPGLEIECRAVRISQVILNLLNNSFDALRDCEERWIDITTEERGDLVAIIVTDSGKGIPDAVLARIMTPFFSTKEPGKGMGLGLSLSRGIAEEHGGSLKAGNSRHAGACMVFEMPRVHTHQRGSSKAA